MERREVTFLEADAVSEGLTEAEEPLSTVLIEEVEREDGGRVSCRKRCCGE